MICVPCGWRKLLWPAVAVDRSLRSRKNTLTARALQSSPRMNQKARELQARTHRFFVRVIHYCEALPRNDATASIGRQLLDAAGSTDSNYRSACRGRSHAEFTAKIGVAAEEADECYGWLLALQQAGFGDPGETEKLIDEADQLTRIFTASQKTARDRKSASEAAKKGVRNARR
jgi:four helix bundle protein